MKKTVKKIFMFHLFLPVFIFLIPAHTQPRASEIKHISDNPQFFSLENQVPTSLVAKEIDRLIRPPLKETLGDVKFISEDTGFAEHEKDGIVILRYIVRKLFDKQDARDLHKACLALHFKMSPRLGSKPQGRKRILMSFLRKGYSLVVSMDTVKQKVEVKAYKIGKSDRLM